MKLLLYSLFILGSVLHVKGEFFQFGDRTNKTCIMLRLDASFNLTYHNGNDSQSAEFFDINGAKVVDRSCECGRETFNSILMVRLFPSREDLKFTFKKNINGDTISMSVDLYVEPSRHFVDMNDTAPFEMKDSGDLFVGHVSKRNHSFLCYATQIVHFNNDAPFRMMMNISNLWVQAYNVTDDAFGPVIECDKDRQTTTSILTTEPTNETTTEALPESTTTPEPGNMTTIVHETTSGVSAVTTSQPVPETTPKSPTVTTMSTKSTTTGPQPATPKFVVKDGDNVCIVLEGDVIFKIRYKKKDNTMGSTEISLPQNAVAAGSCRFNNSASAQEIMLSFFQSTWILSIIFSKDGQDSIRSTVRTTGYSWQRIQLNYTMDGHFPDAIDKGENKNVEADIAFGKFKADEKGSYKCTAEQNLDIGEDNSVTMELSNMQYRAFGTTTSTNFPSQDVSECDADKNNDDTGTDHKTLGIVLGGVFGGLAVLILLAGLIWYFRKRKTNPYDSL